MAGTEPEACMHTQLPLEVDQKNVFTFYRILQIMAKRLNNSSTNSVKKKPKWEQKYKDSYEKEFPFIQASRKDNLHAFCTTCCQDISISHGGRNDILKHKSTITHGRNQSASSSQSTVSTFFSKTDEDMDVINAETLFVGFLTEHNIPLAVSDHAGALFKRMFPDSKIAKKYSCGRTKTSCIVKEMAKVSSTEVANNLRIAPYSAATDGSSDGNAVASETLYPVVVRWFNDETGQIDASLLSMPASKDSTGEGMLFDILNQ